MKKHRKEGKERRKERETKKQQKNCFDRLGSKVMAAFDPSPVHLAGVGYEGFSVKQLQRELVVTVWS